MIEEICLSAYWESLRRRMGGFLVTGSSPHHQPLPLAWLREQLASGGSLTNGWLSNHFGLLRWTVHLLGWLPFRGRVGLGRRLKSPSVSSWQLGP